VIWELLKMVDKQRGQSLIEVVFSIGVLIMVIAAVVDLVVKTTGVKSMELQRKKASEMSEVIVENLLDDKKNSPNIFWMLSEVKKGTTLPNFFDGYTYGVGFTNVGCGTGIGTSCVSATITIDWGNSQTFVVNRFFTDKI
jgi:type II secretory pathway pseudopilin PulG